MKQDGAERYPEEAQIDALFAAGAFSSLARLGPRYVQLGSKPEALGAAEKVAVACAIVDDTDMARHLFRSIIDVSPEPAGALINLAVLELKAGDYLTARQLLERAERQAPQHPNLPFNLGVVLFSLGEFRAARIYLDRAATQGAVAARLYLARCHIELGDYDRARGIAETTAFDALPGVRERYELSRLWTALDRPQDAERVLQHLLQDFPDEAPARINLAVLHERANRIDDAERQLSLSSDQSSALFWVTRAKLEMARRRWDATLTALQQAKAMLDPAGGQAETDRLLSEIEFGRGQALDRLGRYAEAVEAFTRGNALIRDHFRKLNPAEKSDGFRIDWLGDPHQLDEAVRQPGPANESGGMPDPVFLVGFPRSGTTLLDQILDAHPALQVLEEKPALEALVRVVGDLPAGYPSALGTLSEPQRQTLRRLYRDEVRRFLRPQPNTRLVDKYPFNLSRVHLVMRVFPRAQWIFAIRHPCDVVLSCFMQNFRFTDSTHGFWSIEQTASIYVQIMSLWLDQRERLRPDCLDVRYEDLVADVGREAQRLTDFLGLPWSDAMLRFNEHAKTRRIATPSYNQVVQPIYQTAKGRWQHYRPAFETALPMLRPLIERLGYPQPD